jgi:1,4-dihydroxy-2-naphthoate octaprenyltransferase
MVFVLTFKDLSLILKLGRFHFLIAGFFSYCAGAFLAILLGSPISWDRFFWGYAVLLPAHLSISYSNDYFDVDVDKYNKPTIFTGGSGVLVKYPHLKPLALKIAIILIFISLILSLLFTVIYSSPIFLILSISGILLAWYYSAPPLQLSYHGWGEWAMIISGFLIPGLGFVALAGYIDLRLLIFTIPTMIYQIFFIMSVEIPDLEGDEIGSKYTFVVKHGRIMGFKMIAISGLLSTIIFLIMGYSNIYIKPNFTMVALISLLPGILGLWVLKNRTEHRKRATNLATYCLASLFLFIILMDSYFFILIW